MPRSERSGSHLRKYQLKKLEEQVTLLRNIQGRQSERENAESRAGWEESRKDGLGDKIPKSVQYCVKDCKEIQPVHSEGDQPWDFFGRNEAKAETPVLWPPHAKS